MIDILTASAAMNLVLAATIIRLLFQKRRLEREAADNRIALRLAHGEKARSTYVKALMPDRARKAGM